MLRKSATPEGRALLLIPAWANATPKLLVRSFTDLILVLVTPGMLEMESTNAMQSELSLMWTSVRRTRTTVMWMPFAPTRSVHSLAPASQAHLVMASIAACPAACTWKTIVTHMLHAWTTACIKMKLCPPTRVTAILASMGMGHTARTLMSVPRTTPLTV
jgi:hypothetical protein